jgi:nicotinate-nucleotide adenylyltransferase
VLAQEAAAQLGLDRVLLVPIGEPAHRRLEPEPGREVRLEMTRLATGENDLMETSDVETAREGPSFTYRTLELLGEQRPGDELVFLMGADVAAGLPEWKEPKRVLELARLGVASRPGSTLEDAQAALGSLGAGDRAEVVEMPTIGISSTAIRRRVAQGMPIRYLVPDAVERFIAKGGLYGV